MRLLLAEDEPDLNTLIVQKLKKEGYAVDSCLDGMEAFHYLTAASYDAAILDIMMPNMDGLTLLHRIRERGIRTPVLFLTARDSIDDRVEGLDTGASDYLALAAENYSDDTQVDFETVWGLGHTTAERTGDSTENFIDWMAECMENINN